MTPTPREEIISLMRGRYATPVLSALGQLGLADALVAGAVRVEDWPDLHAPTLAALFDYGIAIGLLTRDLSSGAVLASPLGTKILPRWGAAAILNSYEECFRDLPALIRGEARRWELNRTENTSGSGVLHGRKYFLPGLDLLGDERVDQVVDIGSGDGSFLAAAAARHPKASLVAVDITFEHHPDLADALETATSRRPTLITGSGFDVSNWAPAVPSTDGRAMISSWFVAHEFLQSCPERAAAWLDQMRGYFPRAELLIGEVIRRPPELLAAYRHSSASPEFTLFHALSGQGLLDWPQWQTAIARSPYRVAAERRFDELKDGQGNLIPANVIWWLTPC